MLRACQQEVHSHVRKVKEEREVTLDPRCVHYTALVRRLGVGIVHKGLNKGQDLKVRQDRKFRSGPARSGHA